MSKLKFVLKNEDGVASIVAVCILVLFTALGLASLLSASSLLKNTQQRWSWKQSEIYAVTLSQSIEKELGGLEITESSSSELSNYLYKNMVVFGYPTSNWGYYNADEFWPTSDIGKMSRNFKYSGDESKKIPETITMYWEYYKDADLMQEWERMQQVKLYITVKCIYKGEEYAKTTGFGISSSIDSADKFWYSFNEGVVTSWNVC